MKGEVFNMECDCMSFEYGKKDGTIQSRDEFYTEHCEIVLDSIQKERLEQNLEVQCILILKEFAEKEIVPQGFYRKFIYKDERTGELYLKPLEIDIKVFFKKRMPIILIYDIRMA